MLRLLCILFLTSSLFAQDYIIATGQGPNNLNRPVSIMRVDEQAGQIIEIANFSFSDSAGQFTSEGKILALDALNDRAYVAYMDSSNYNIYIASFDLVSSSLIFTQLLPGVNGPIVDLDITPDGSYLVLSVSNAPVLFKISTSTYMPEAIIFNDPQPTNGLGANNGIEVVSNERCLAFLPTSVWLSPAMAYEIDLVNNIEVSRYNILTNSTGYGNVPFTKSKNGICYANHLSANGQFLNPSTLYDCNLILWAAGLPPLVVTMFQSYGVPGPLFYWPPRWMNSDVDNAFFSIIVASENTPSILLGGMPAYFPQYGFPYPGLITSNVLFSDVLHTQRGFFGVYRNSTAPLTAGGYLYDNAFNVVHHPNADLYIDLTNGVSNPDLVIGIASTHAGLGVYNMSTKRYLSRLPTNFAGVTDLDVYYHQ